MDMPNKGKKYSGGKMGSKGGASNTGACSGLKKEDTQRSDVLQKPSSKNPYPNGLA